MGIHGLILGALALGKGAAPPESPPARIELSFLQRTQENEAVRGTLASAPQEATSSRTSVKNRGKGGAEEDFARLLPRLLPEEIYYPREQLNRPPQLERDVDLSRLANLPGLAPGRITLELFIDENGSVSRIAAEEAGSLNDQALASLEELLLQLKFKSGEIGGSTVKSRIRIEVLIEPPRHEAPGPAAGPSQ